MADFLDALNAATIGRPPHLPSTFEGLVQRMGWQGYCVWHYSGRDRALRPVLAWGHVGGRRSRAELHKDPQLVATDGVVELAWWRGAVWAHSPGASKEVDLAVPLRESGHPMAVIVFATGLPDPIDESLRARAESVGDGILAQLYSTYRHTLDPDPLTAREQEVLQWFARGRTIAQVASSMVIAVSTVRTHVERIYDKLDVPDRGAAVAQGMRLGIIA